MTTSVSSQGFGVHACSLKRSTSQMIDPGTTYQIVQFPFGSSEPSDRYNMHQLQQPDGYVIDSVNWDSDPRSGLIWPNRAGWGTLQALLQWDPSDATEYRDQFVRDPLGFTSNPNDTTATDHRAVTPGGQYWTKVWGIFVDPSTPLALRVTHNATAPTALTIAEFKLIIHYAE